jgi:hypothetical protein
VAAGAEVVEDHRAIHRAAVGDLRSGLVRGSLERRGLRRRTGGTGVHVTGRRDARQLALGHGRVCFRHQGALQVVREDDQHHGEGHEEADHHREFLEEVEVVVAHDPSRVRGCPRRAE